MRDEAIPDVSDSPTSNNSSSSSTTSQYASIINRTKAGAIDLVAGAIGGAVGVYVGQPLDTVKVKLQTFPHFYGGMTNCFMKTYREGGIKSLYAGTVPSVTAQVGENAVLFCAYGFCQRAVRFVFNIPMSKEMSWVQNASAGGLAAFFSSLVLCPTELVKCRMQAHSELIKSGEIHLVSTSHMKDSGRAFPITMNIIRQHGIRGLFRGLTSTLAREMPGYFFFFGGYEGSKSVIKNISGNDEGIFVTALSGGVAGVCFWTTVYPADVIKSKMQVTSVESQNIFRAALTVLKVEGTIGLYRGFLPAVIRTFPSTSALFITYEYVKSSLEKVT